jgi:tetratricopeptide (TPR) repeat protein
MNLEKTDIATEVGQLFGTAPDGAGAVPEGPIAAVPALTYSQQERLYMRASNLYGQGLYKEALKLLWILLRVAPIEARFHQATASCFQMLGLYQEAMLSYGSAWMLNVDNADPLFYVGQCFLGQDKPAEACAAFEEFLDRSKADPEKALCKRARSYISHINEKV